jgi:hypothetical protein
MLSTFTRGTVLLPNDDVLPTANASTECFEENLLPKGALLPNSAHMSLSSLYQFLVLTEINVVKNMELAHYVDCLQDENDELRKLWVGCLVMSLS